MADFRERFDDHEETLRAALEGFQANLWTALPGIIQAFDPAKGTVLVQPALQLPVRQPDGTTKNLALPLIPDVPVMFPRGGGFTLTFPIQANDECLLMFASRCIDYWWQQGGVQLPIDARMHHLSDAFAFVGVMSQARLLTSGASATTTQLRSDDGGTFVELSGGGIVTVTAPTKIVFNTPELHVGGKVTTTGDVTAGTVSLQHHVHQNTQPGSGLSGQPQP